MTIHSNEDSFSKNFIVNSRSLVLQNWTFSKHFLKYSNSFTLLGSYHKTLKYLKFKFSSFSYFVPCGNLISSTLSIFFIFNSNFNLL